MDNQRAQFNLDLSLLLTAPKPVREVVDYDMVYGLKERNSYQDLMLTRQGIEMGIMPPLASGFRFVIDRRPEGQEYDYIPAQEYTAYFANWCIPISPPGHRLHEHDVAHVRSYQAMFANAHFADSIVTAATNALPDVNSCKEFTGAMDKLGDAMRNLDEIGTYFSFIRDARTRLHSLVALARHGLPYDAASSNELFEAMDQALGLSVTETYAIEDPRRIIKEYRPILIGSIVEYPTSM